MCVHIHDAFFSISCFANENQTQTKVNGLVWDSIGETLAGVSQSSATGAPGLVLRRLDVATGKWSSTPITSE